MTGYRRERHSDVRRAGGDEGAEAEMGGLC